MEKCQPHSTWLEIDLNAIENNIRRIARHTGVQVMAIVKANAYGHGEVPTAPDEKADQSRYVLRVKERHQQHDGRRCRCVLCVMVVNAGLTNPRVEHIISSGIWLQARNVVSLGYKVRLCRIDVYIAFVQDRRMI